LERVATKKEVKPKNPRGRVVYVSYISGGSLKTKSLELIPGDQLVVKRGVRGRIAKGPEEESESPKKPLPKQEKLATILVTPDDPQYTKRLRVEISELPDSFKYRKGKPSEAPQEPVKIPEETVTEEPSKPAEPVSRAETVDVEEPVKKKAEKPEGLNKYPTYARKENYSVDDPQLEDKVQNLIIGKGYRSEWEFSKRSKDVFLVAQKAGILQNLLYEPE
jgi:hypothetical protein